MKWFLLFCLILLIAWQTFRTKKSSAITNTKTEKLTKDTINFSSQVQPILVKHCSPCHFTGGKMYEKLPFDKDTTILNHHEAILKRIKNEDENSILKRFVLQNKKGLPESKP